MSEGGVSAVRWFENTCAALKAARKIWEISRPRLAPDFNAIRFLRADEYGLSTLLGDLLAPYGSHGQGKIFLETFVSNFWKGMEVCSTGAKVELESRTSLIVADSRRIDIRIRFTDGSVLAIENKVWDAQDQDDQVRDYLEELAKSHSPYRLIYLSGIENRLPEKNSISEDQRESARNAGTLLCIGWSRLVPWLASCIAVCKSERVRVFLDDFVTYIQTDIQGIGNMNELTLIVDAATHTKESVYDALQIVAVGDAIKRKLFERFKKDLKEHILKESVFRGWNVDLSENPMDIHGGINIMPHHSSRYNFRLSFDESGGNGVFIGIAADNDQGYSDGEILSREIKQLFPAAKSNKEWLFWLKAEPFHHWARTPEAMALLWDSGNNGMAALIANEFVMVYKRLQAGNLLHALGFE